MIPAPSLQFKCPHCGAVKPLCNLESGNTFDGMHWSDTKSFYPMMPEISGVQKCYECGKYYFLFDAKEVSSQDSVEYSLDTGTLNFVEAKEALEQLYEKASEHGKFLLRQYVLYAYNDLYRYEEGIEEPAEDRSFFIENCLAMAQMTQTIGTLKAELYREAGDFEKCIQILDTLGPVEEFEQSVRGRIREKALQGDTRVFQL